MPRVKFTSALKRFFPNLTETTVPSGNIGEVLQKLESDYPGILHYLVDDAGVLRKHVNIFIRGELIKDRQELSDRVSEQDEIMIMQALSGG
ncbi:MAG: MoaD/ThiS family protein [Cyclobacteriaceae bacterium]|jgi:molybdopterin converting factor small subunit|nr:MoaD/ThiS family protein [Cyclobacteriaceae bacterium]